MNLMLILRSEMACLIILIFLYFTSRSYQIDSGNKVFSRIIRLSMLHVVFDAVTVITVNNLDVVPNWVNWICHIIFYISAILYSNEIANYAVAICYPTKAKKAYALGHIMTAVYICCLPFLKITYVAANGTNSSAGPAAIVGYGLAFSFFITALIIIFTHMNKMSTSIKSALIPMMLVLMVTEISQVIWRSVLFTGGAITIVTVGFFFSLENPVEVFKKKAMTDALTGVRSRSSYEEDIEKYNRKFLESPNDNYTFVFCDMNDLRNVNNRFGHAEGDNYITLIAASIKKCMVSATSVYRIGGDEFLVLYYRTAKETVDREIRELQDTCHKASENLNYTAAVSTGYAISSEQYKSLDDVVKSADYAMYQNKIKIKNGETVQTSNLNYAGLTDKVFDVMCASNDYNYPFITNMDTNVTRIAPGWKEFFGLDNEFYFDFMSVWGERIHNDYRQGYLEDIAAVINGHRKYHSYDYLAKTADGEYVHIGCHGSLYQDISTGTSYFTGFITNYAKNKNIDPVTGLPNFDILTSRVCKYLDEGFSFSLLKLQLNSFARVNMLYGYADGNVIIKKVASLLSAEIGDNGDVYCNNSVNFTLLFKTDDKALIENFYKKIYDTLASGVEIGIGTVPILISGGAYINSGEYFNNEKIRRGLAYAVEESKYYQHNALVFYRESDSNSDGADISLLTKIHADAISEMKYFELRYQPIVNVSDKQTVGAEALLRWIHPEYGEINPGKFIAFIENDPCYYRLGLNIIENAVKDAKKMRDKIPDFKININITALQLRNEAFADNVSEILDKYGYPACGVVFELTERCKEMDVDFLAKKIGSLRSKGFLIAFDDLGTGYSTISLLMDIPVDEIKLDRSFVSDLSTNDSYQVFVKALVLGRTYEGKNYTICFEGIETDEMLNTVKAFGNHLAQGYYFAKPLMIEELYRLTGA